jgi:hypothetical protein
MRWLPGRLAEGFLGRLRFPTLFVLFVVLAGLDLVVPDFVPFVDEVGLALLAALFGTWRRRRKQP